MSTSPADDFYAQVRWSIPCCPNCENFRSKRVVDMRTDPAVEFTKEYCELDPEERTPPAKVIAFGCPKFIQDIPF